MAIKDNSTFKKRSGILIAIIGWIALILQLIVMLHTNTKNGISVTVTLINFFSFFTILSNILVAISLTSSQIFPNSKAGIFFSKPKIQSGITLYIIIVGLVYSLVLRKIWNPEGLQLIADRMLHDLIPILCVVYWFAFTPKNVLQWKNVSSWLLFPAAYLIYSLLRGAYTNWHPYYFINTQELGMLRVVLNAFLVLTAFIILGLLLIFTNRLGKAER